MKAQACCLLAACTFASTYSTPSYSQPSTADKALATRMYDDAEKLMAAGDYASACPKYAESQQRDPQLGTLLHLADCYEKAGKFMSAWVSFNEAVEVAARKVASGAKETRGQTAKDRAAALEGKLSNLTIKVTQGDAPGFEVKQNGAVVSRAVWGTAMPVDPGSYAITAQATGKKPWSANAEVAANGLRVEVTVPALENDTPGATAPAVLPPAGTPPAGGPPVATPLPQDPNQPAATVPQATPVGTPPNPDDDAPSPGRGQRIVGWIVAGVGVVSLGAGASFGLASKQKVKERDDVCPNPTCSRAKYDTYMDLEKQAQTAATLSNVGFVIGGLAVATGLILVITAPSRPSNTAASLHVGPWAGPNNAGGAMMGGTW